MLHSPISFSLVMRVETPNHPGSFGILTEAIHDAGGTISALDMHAATKERVVRDVTINVPSDAVADDVRAAIEAIEGARIISASDETFLAHLGGKIHIAPKIPVKNRQDLSTVYAPGVARVSMAIAADPRKAFQLTIKRNTVAVVTDGTAVLGLGDIGPLGALPVMEGKAMLFRQFGDIDAFPICLDTKDVNEIVETVVCVAPAFGGINLEDISAPRCFEIEERLIEALDIPIMHDDQHGTAVVILAALINAARVVGKELQDLQIVIAGSGVAGTATLKMLLDAGVRDVIPVDRSGSLTDALPGADVFIGLSAPVILRPEDVARMARDPIVFAMANPIPEIMPDLAAPLGAVVATGRSDFPNQINNLLAFPGIFRGALDARARRITERMKHAAAVAIAGMVRDDERCAEYIIPSILDPRVCTAVAKAVAAAAAEDGVARKA
jgi:malate dehydrogenase (oxaloacetate-decarboxylating)